MDGSKTEQNQVLTFSNKFPMNNYFNFWIKLIC